MEGEQDPSRRTKCNPLPSRVNLGTGHEVYQQVAGDPRGNLPPHCVLVWKGLGVGGKQDPSRRTKCNPLPSRVTLGTGHEVYQQVAGDPRGNLPPHCVLFWKAASKRREKREPGGRAGNEWPGVLVEVGGEGRGGDSIVQIVILDNRFSGCWR